MSNYCWERGTLVLPTAAVPEVKKALRDAHNRMREHAKAEARRFWVDVARRTRSTRLYNERLWGFEPRPVTTIYPKVPDVLGYGRLYVADPVKVHLADEFHSMLASLADQPRQVTEADLDTYFGPKATNRTTRFDVNSEATITFDGRKATWDVPENNHANERAAGAYLGIVFFDALRKVNWTRGTGGQILGNNEYNRDAARYDAGAGGSYVVHRFGPLGEDRRLRRPTRRSA